MKLENNFLQTILQKQVYQRSFLEIVNDFDKKLTDFNPIKNSILIEDYFTNGNGPARIRKKLLDDNVFKKQNIYSYKTKTGRTKKDVKGLYVFIYDESPIYVGISRGLINRILQHLRGRSHNTSTLAYNIGLIEFEILRGEKYIGRRSEFDFNNNVRPAKDFLLKQRIAFLPIENDEELYLFEVFCAMNLKCWLNKFKTH